jgi:hypothetical protein
VEDAAGTGIADLAIGNRDMRICVCRGGVTEGGGLRRCDLKAQYCLTATAADVARQLDTEGLEASYGIPYEPGPVSAGQARATRDPAKSRSNVATGRDCGRTPPVEDPRARPVGPFRNEEGCLRFPS